MRHDRAIKGRSGTESGGATDLPEDVARLRAANQVDVAGAAGDQRARRLKDEDRVGIVRAVEGQRARHAKGAGRRCVHAGDKGLTCELSENDARASGPRRCCTQLVSAAFAPWVTPSLVVWFAPVSVTQFAPGQEAKPVSAGVGDEPTSPLIVVMPVFVMPEPARIAKLSAVPSGTVVAAACAVPVAATNNPAMDSAMKEVADARLTEMRVIRCRPTLTR